MKLFNTSRGKGQWFENQARRFLEQQGLRFVDANYQIRGGELDLVFTQANELVFVEVRYRQTRDFGGAAASITTDKLTKLRRTALHYLQKRGLSPDRTPCRFDVVAISGSGRDIEIDWIRNAF